jgi:5-methylthioadenosine/S-adenosylhomocysteine deaminase
MIVRGTPVPSSALSADWVIAFQDGEHRIIREGTVVVEDDQIAWVGPGVGPATDERSDFGECILAPGLISLHSHMHTGPTDKSAREDADTGPFGPTGLIEYIPPLIESLDDEAKRASITFSLLEHVWGGATTVMDMGDMPEVVAEEAERLGVRCYLGDYFKQGMFGTTDGETVSYTWDLDGGRLDFERATRFTEQQNAAGSELVRGFMSPLHVDTISPELLQAAKTEATRLRVPLQIHAAEAIFEVTAIRERYGLSPVEWLHSLGVLDADTILGHCLFVSGMSWNDEPGNDLQIVADAGSSVVYSPWCFVMTGVLMESFPKYAALGINVCLGTDAVPQSMVESMRYAALSGKIVDRGVGSSTAPLAFNAATLNAARFLRRNDLGRIAPRAKADLVVWNCRTPRMTPLYDPIRNLVYYAGSEEIQSVMIGGRWVIRDRQFQGEDIAPILRRVQEGAERMWSRYHQNDWKGRSFEEVYPRSYRPFIGPILNVPSPPGG